MLAREKYAGRTHAGSGQRRACQAPSSVEFPVMYGKTPRNQCPISPCWSARGQQNCLTPAM